MTPDQAAKFFYIHGNVGRTEYELLRTAPTPSQLQAAYDAALRRGVEPRFAEEAKAAIERHFHEPVPHGR